MPAASTGPPAVCAGQKQALALQGGQALQRAQAQALQPEQLRLVQGNRAELVDLCLPPLGQRRPVRIVGRPRFSRPGPRRVAVPEAGRSLPDVLGPDHGPLQLDVGQVLLGPHLPGRLLPLFRLPGPERPDIRVVHQPANRPLVDPSVLMGQAEPAELRLDRLDGPLDPIQREPASHRELAQFLARRHSHALASAAAQTSEASVSGVPKSIPSRRCQSRWTATWARATTGSLVAAAKSPKLVGPWRAAAISSGANPTWSCSERRCDDRWSTPLQTCG